jgi:hypothetical protein
MNKSACRARLLQPFGQSSNCPNTSVLRIRDVYPGYEFFHPGSQVKNIPDPGSASKNLSIYNPKKLFLSSRKYDSGIFIPDPDLDFFYPSRIPDPGSRNQKGTGSRIRNNKKHKMEGFCNFFLTGFFMLLHTQAVLPRMGGLDGFYA